MGLEQQKHVEHGLKVILVRCKYHAAKDYVHVFHFSDSGQETREMIQELDLSHW